MILSLFGEKRFFLPLKYILWIKILILAVQIAVNTRLLLKNRLDGIGWFSYQTLKRITRQQKDVHFVFLFDRPFDEEFIFSDNITPLVISPQARHPFLYWLWFEVSVKNTLNRLKPDLFLSPDGFLSLGATCKQLPVIHDINFRHNPKDSKLLTRHYYNRYFPMFAKKATRIATVSEFSKADIADSYGIDRNRIDVVYNGINEIFNPVKEEVKKVTREKYTKGADYFLFVGSLHPRKNAPRLLRAFEKFKNESNSPVKLVFAGPHFWGTGEIEAVLKEMRHKDEVVFTGRLNNDELNGVMASALGLVFVPYFEGFGIPIVEAMQCEVPVICSNVTSMPEVAGPAALQVDPLNVDEITNAMLQLYRDEKLRKDLVEAGKLQKLNFSWDKSAGLLWKSIEKTMNQ